MKTFNYKTLTIVLAALLSFSFSSYATNLATSATATASHEQQAAANAIDGNEGTRWETESADPQWLAVTLDAVYSINSIKIYWEGASAQSYTVKVSTDSATWTQVYAMTDGTGSRWDDISFTSIDAKYIVMDGTVRSTVYGYSIWELQVFEAVSDTENATLSDLKVGDDTIDDFSSNTKEYTSFVEDGMVPTVTATASIVGANVNIIPASAIPGTTMVVVTATDGTTKDTTKVNFKEPIGFPLDFEASAADYQWGDFGAPTSVIANPQSSGINTSLQVAQVIKSGPDDWSGSFVTIDSPFSLSSESRVTAKFYSPRSGINMMMKLEDAAGAATAEIQVATTVADQWETLVFDFTGSDLTKDYVKIVIICDRATVGDGTAAHTYLVDDIQLYVADPAKDASLSDLKVDNTTIDNFASSKTEYSYTVTSSIVPEVTYTTSVVGATVEVTDATSIPGTTTVAVQSSDGTENETYYVNFTMNTECSGSSTEASEGTFTDGFTYDFATSGTDVMLTFTLLDDKEGIVAYLHNVTDGFVETQMTGNNTDGFALTLTNQIADSDISVRCKFAYAGGLTTTTTLTYTVGDDCAGTPTELQSASSTELKAYPNPVVSDLTINLSDVSYKQFSVYNLSGQSMSSQAIDGTSSTLTIDMSSFASGVYMIQLTNDSDAKMLRVIKQ